jgi:flagellar basal-body rod protein FlgB
VTSDIAAFQLLQNALNVAQLRQRVYANNIANIDTPGYKREDVSFESRLASAMNSQSGAQVFGVRHISLSSQSNPNWQSMLQVKPRIIRDTSTIVSNNGNNVDVDAEMAKLAENQIRYNALVQDVSMRVTRMKTAINGG